MTVFERILILLWLLWPALGWLSPILFQRDPYCRDLNELSAKMKGRKRQRRDPQLGHYTLTYSPNFNRHLVSYEETSGGKKIAVQSFKWLDEALKAYPNVTLDSMDPPPKLSLAKAPGQVALLSRIVAGGGVNESSVYYDDGYDATIRSPAMKNNGGSYLYRFLAKLYAADQTIRAADIHREVMDAFPPIAFYDAALVHERLFFLLSPLPPVEVLEKLKASMQVKPTKRARLSGGGNASSFFDDLPTLFYRFGYGVGLTKFQLAHALQSLPQYWLPIYLGDALASSKKPQDVAPYILHHLNAHPTAFVDTADELYHLLTGTAWADVASLAHAKSSLKLTGDQCHVLLHAFPTLRTSETEPNWAHKGKLRPIHEESMAYLRLRLQLDPVQIFSMIKTHKSMSSYPVNDRLKPILDGLQTKLGLQSEELQKLILRMPSLLGMSLSSLDARIHFFLVEVGLTSAQLKISVLKLPALLQYSLPNLEAKLGFFREDLHIQDQSVLVKMLVAKPVVWGLSAEHNLKPTAASFGSFFGWSPHEIGKIVSRAPELLVLNWKRNLEPKLIFLLDRLSLTHCELGWIVMSSPRMLTYSLQGSLKEKIDMLEAYLSQDQSRKLLVKDVLLQRPSLLITSKKQLIETLSGREAFSTQAEKGRKGRAASRGKNNVLEISLEGSVLKEFSSVNAAADAVGTSSSNMYSVLRQGRTFRGKKYCYGQRCTQRLRSPTDVVSESERSCNANRRSIDPLSYRQEDREKVRSVTAEKEDSRVTVYVSGRVYPPDDPSQARGNRRVGGMVVAMPSLSRSFTTFFEEALQDCYGPQVLGVKSCQFNDSQGGLLAALIGYTNLDPTRRRCSLFSCAVALRIVTRILLLIGRTSKANGSQSVGSNEPCPTTPTQIDIVTDSSYAFELLRNTSQVWDWGSALTPEDFVYTGKGTKWFANTDILYTLSRAYYKLVDPQDVLSSLLQANLTIRFVLDSEELTPLVAAEFRLKMDSWGKEAAKLYYERSYTGKATSQV